MLLEHAENLACLPQEILIVYSLEFYKSRILYILYISLST